MTAQYDRIIWQKNSKSSPSPRSMKISYFDEIRVLNCIDELEVVIFDLFRQWKTVTYMSIQKKEKKGKKGKN